MYAFPYVFPLNDTYVALVNTVESATISFNAKLVTFNSETNRYVEKLPILPSPCHYPFKATQHSIENERKSMQ
jgi:hypothetical protein